MSKDFTHCQWNEQQWENFSSVILEAYKIPVVGLDNDYSEEFKHICCTEESKAFIEKFLISHTKSSLNKDAKLWVRVLRDSLADSLNLDSQSGETVFNSYSLQERCSLFVTAHKEAIKKLEEKAFEMMEKFENNYSQI
jgi:hypothetical protein